MHLKLAAKLQETIQDFMNDNCEEEEWPSDAMVHPNLSLHMAKSAEAVFDATVESSIFTKKES